MDRRIRWISALAPAAAALALYVATLAPTVATGDSGELSTVAAKLGLAHPPGYPTFTMLGHLFTFLPFGDSAYRVNLMSALFGAATVLVAAVIAGRLVEASRRRGRDSSEPAWLGWAAGAIGAVSLALSTAFWQYSLVAEVFALADFLALLLLLLMLEWRRQPETTWLLWAAALVAGIALTNQQTIVFAAPALVILLGLGLQRFTAAPAGRQVGRPMPWKLLAVAVLVGLVGLLPYIYLPLAAAAGAPSAWGDPTTPGGFLAIVTRSAYGTFSLTVRETSGSVLEHLALFGGYLVTAFTPVGIALAAIGAGWLGVRRAGETAALAVWFVMTGPVFLALANPPLQDPITRGVLERFYLLPSLPVFLTIAVGAFAVASWLGRHVSVTTGRQWVSPAAVTAMLVVLGGLAMVRLPDVDASDNRVAETYADDLLSSLPANTLLLMRRDENYTSVTYAQTVRGVRPDVVAIDVELLKLEAYVDLIGASNPEIRIPFPRYDGGVRTYLADLILDVIDARPVFVVGPIAEDLRIRLDLLDEGLADQVRPNGEVSDPLASLRTDPGIFGRLHPPERPYPGTSWEAAIAANYADVAFKTGVALQELGPQPNAAEVERFYRAAIRISPTLASAYKNLGLLLQTNAGPADQIISLWERYLELRPDDPEAGEIRATVERLRGGPSPAP